MFITEVYRAFLTFFICLMQVVTGALTVGFLPALVLIGYHKRHKMLTLWIILWLGCVAGAFYGIPQGFQAWRTHLNVNRFKPAAMYLGYFVGVLGAFFVLPEPMRQARIRIRRPPPRDKNVWQDEDGREYKRKRRRKKRRTNDYDV